MTYCSALSNFHPARIVLAVWALIAVMNCKHGEEWLNNLKRIKLSCPLVGVWGIEVTGAGLEAEMQCEYSPGSQYCLKTPFLWSPGSSCVCNPGFNSPPRPNQSPSSNTKPGGHRCPQRWHLVTRLPDSFDNLELCFSWAIQTDGHHFRVSAWLVFVHRTYRSEIRWILCLLL